MHFSILKVGFANCNALWTHLFLRPYLFAFAFLNFFAERKLSGGLHALILAMLLPPLT